MQQNIHKKVVFLKILSSEWKTHYSPIYKNDFSILKKIFLRVIFSYIKIINLFEALKDFFEHKGYKMMKRKNFTLIEILGVCALIAILGIIGFGSYTFAMNKSKDSATRALMKQIEAGLAGIKNECGYYPSTNGYIVIKFYDENNPGSDVVNTLPGKLMSISNNSLDDITIRKAFNKATDAETIAKYIESGELKDAFGNSIYYCFPGKINTTSYDLISAGPDGNFGNGNAATPNTNTSPNNYKDADGQANCDDITNF